MALPKMKLGQPHNSNEFNFDPPPATPSSTSLEPALYIPSSGLDTAHGSPGHASNNPYSYLADLADPFVSGDPPQLYRPAAEIDTETVNGVTNGAVGNIFGSLVPDPEPNSIYDDDEQFAMLLQAYNERGPSPTQGCDEDWSNMAATAHSVNEPTGNPVTSSACSPGVAANTTNITDTPKTNVSAAPTTSPTTPSSATRKLIDTMSKSPIEIPITSHFTDFHPASPIPKKKSGSGKRRSSSHGPNGAEESSRSSSARQNTPAKQKLGSPFKMPALPASAPAKRVPDDNISMSSLYSPSPAVSQPLLMGNMSPSMTAAPGYSSLQMQTMADQRNLAMSANYGSPQNLLGFTNEVLSSGGSSGGFLENDVAFGEQPSAKRARTHMFGAHAILTNVSREEQMHHQTHFQHIPQGTGAAAASLAHHFRDTVEPDFKWLERDRTDPEPPPSAVAIATGFEFPIPMPSARAGGVEGQEEEDVMVGQKRKAVHMSQGEIETNNIQDPYAHAGLGNAQIDPHYLGLFIPRDQRQSISCVQGQDAMLSQDQFQSPQQAQIRGQFHGQSHPQVQMSERAQGQRQLPRTLPNSRQQHAHGQRGLPHRPIDRQQQMTMASPSAGRDRAPGTPTPKSRRRSTLSKGGQKDVSSSPRSGTPRKNVQTPNGRSFETPTNNTPAQSSSFLQTPNQTPRTNETRAVVPLHLPTPRQPISTGSAPNTISETLAETNRRTAFELRALGAPVVDYDPNMNWDDNTDASFGALFGDASLYTPAPHGTYGDVTDFDMPMPATMDVSMLLDGSGSGSGNMSENVGGHGSNPFDPAVCMSQHADGGVMTTSPSNGNYNSNHHATDAPGIASPANGLAVADASFATETAVPVTAADLGVPCEWTKEIEGENFDEMDFGF